MVWHFLAAAEAAVVSYSSSGSIRRRRGRCSRAHSYQLLPTRYSTQPADSTSIPLLPAAAATAELENTTLLLPGRIYTAANCNKVPIHRPVRQTSHYEVSIKHSNITSSPFKSPIVIFFRDFNFNLCLWFYEIVCWHRIFYYDIHVKNMM